MNRLLLLTSAMTVFALPAGAQTILSLSATGAAVAAPDQAVAHFEVQATKPDAASAQASVNQAVGKALEAARAVSGVVATTGGYNTYSFTPDHRTTKVFTAQQNLTLTQPAADGIPNAAFSALLAKLQSEGLLLTGLSGDLSPAGESKLQREATHNALLQLRADANDIAETLHKKVGTLETLNVNAGDAVVPPIGPRVMMMAASAQPPQSAPGNITITARVSAKIALESTP